MIEIKTDDLALVVNENQLKTLQIQEGEGARQMLAALWGTDLVDLSHYLAIFYDKSLTQLTEDDSFITLSFSLHGYVVDAEERIDAAEAQKQIEIDLEIINRESQWTKEESIYFDKWWPKPTMDVGKKMLEFGVSLKDFNQQVFNRTLNRIFLTRYGHMLLNYSLSEAAASSTNPLLDYQNKLDEIVMALTISEGFRYSDVDEDNDIPSRSRLINLILSSEIF